MRHAKIELPPGTLNTTIGARTWEGRSDGGQNWGIGAYRDGTIAVYADVLMRLTPTEARALGAALIAAGYEGEGQQ